MTISFKQFLSESFDSDKNKLDFLTGKSSSKEEVEKIAAEYADCFSGPYEVVKIGENYFVNVDGNVNFKRQTFEYLPVPFFRVRLFDCSYCINLKSTAGLPQVINDGLILRGCQSLTSLNEFGRTAFICYGPMDASDCINLEGIYGPALDEFAMTIGQVSSADFSGCKKLKSLNGLGCVFNSVNIVGTAIHSLQGFDKTIEFGDHANSKLILVSNGIEQLINDGALNLMKTAVKIVEIGENSVNQQWADIINDAKKNKLDIFKTQQLLLAAKLKEHAKA